MSDYGKCSRCRADLNIERDEPNHINVTMPTVGVVDLCGGCWLALVEWCAGMVRAR